MNLNAHNTDWCSEFWTKRYPHVVHVARPQDKFLRYNWLLDNVGDRGGVWEYPTEYIYIFKHHDHAVLFSLTWSHP